MNEIKNFSARTPSEIPSYEARLNRELFKLTKGERDELQQELAVQQLELQDRYAERERMQVALQMANQREGSLRVFLEDVALQLTRKFRGKFMNAKERAIVAQIRSRLSDEVRRDHA